MASHETAGDGNLQAGSLVKSEFANAIPALLGKPQIIVGPAGDERRLAVREGEWRELALNRAAAVGPADLVATLFQEIEIAVRAKRNAPRFAISGWDRRFLKPRQIVMQDADLVGLELGEGHTRRRGRDVIGSGRINSGRGGDGKFVDVASARVEPANGARPRGPFHGAAQLGKPDIAVLARGDAPGPASWCQLVALESVG